MSSLVVNDNLSALGAYNNLTTTSNKESQAISELSSGLQIQTAADNPAGYVTAQNLLAQSNGYQTAMSNAQNGVSLIQTASGALNQITSLLQTMNSLALSSANGATNDAGSLSANEAEFTALQAQIDQIASTTSFGGSDKNLLDGTFSAQVLQIGAFAASSNQITLSIAGASSSALGVSSAVGVSSATLALVAVSAVQAALNTVSKTEAAVGATQNQLTSVVANLTVGQQNLQAAYSGLVDVNFAQETTSFSTDQILMQSGVSMLSQAQQAPSMVLKLLQ